VCLLAGKRTSHHGEVRVTHKRANVPLVAGVQQRQRME
jgi:hypothetical protein